MIRGKGSAQCLCKLKFKQALQYTLKQTVGLKRKFRECYMMYVTQWANLADSGMQTLSDEGRTRGWVNRTFMDYWPYRTLETELEIQFVQKLTGKQWQLGNHS